MTTIVWDGKTLAADSQVSSECARVGKTPKLRQLAENLFVAAAGYQSDTLMFEVWAAGGFKQDAKPCIEGDEFQAIVIAPDGVFEFESALMPCPLLYPTAIGSGWMWAIAALDFGATAEDAVKYAATRDVFTNDEVNFVHVTIAEPAPELKSVPGEPEPAPEPRPEAHVKPKAKTKVKK